ncbi:N-6 DNA methylase [Micromonospora coerulea]|uniref:N-6 DNA methylase n=1 Tax=Micromonospora coerulea TaxID=47856 RepID=UPI001903CC55|nr:N-6 DNA methylase [Micromonospora veneta]
MDEHAGHGSPYVSLADIAVMARVSRPAVSNWRRRHVDFPKPVEETGTTSLFSLDEVRDWMARNGKRFELPGADEAVWAALNRARGSALPEDAAELAMIMLAARHALADQDFSEILRDGLLAEDTSSLKAALLLGQLEQLLTDAGAEYLLRPAIPTEWFAASGPFLRAVDDLSGEYGVPAVFEGLVTATSRAGGRARGASITPSGVADLMAALVQPIAGTVLDPACGYGTTLVTAERRAKGPVLLLGTEINQSAYRLARARILVHDLPATITLADTLVDGSGTAQADVILADPPYGQSWRPDVDREPSRWEFGVPPPSRADLLWVQHAVSRLAPHGRAAVALPHGALFRGGTEASIRQALVEAGCVHAIISLPAGLYPSTGIPVAIWVLGRPASNSNRTILFIDASQVGEGKPTRKELTEADIEEILDCLESRRSNREPKRPDRVRAAAIPIDEVAAGDGNLMPSRWIVRGVDPVAMLERAAQAMDALRTRTKAAHSLTAPELHLTAPTSLTRRLTVAELVERRFIRRFKGRKLDLDSLREGPTPLIRAGDIGPGLTVRSSRGIRLEDLPNAAELTEPGDVLVVVEGASTRVGVDMLGGSIIATPAIQVLRPRTDVIHPLTLALMIRGAANAHLVGTTVPRLDLERVEIRLLESATGTRLADVLTDLIEQRTRAAAIVEGVDDVLETLASGFAAGVLNLYGDGAGS